MTLTREQIMERLQTDSKTIGTTRTPLTDAVPDEKMRYIVLIRLHGDGVASRTVDIEKLKRGGSETEDADFTMKFDDAPVAPADVREIPESDWDIEKPVLVLEGGTRPYGKVSGGTGLNCTIVYWDSEI
jgi:hypothetical protein